MAKVDHGHSIGGDRSRTYRAWVNMKGRCLNPKNTMFKDYGGRGISVAPQWVDNFAQFLTDMGECPPGLTLDRKDNDLGYRPGNVRWATSTQQNRNRRNTVMLTHLGVTKTLPEWAEETGLSQSMIRKRMLLKWPTARVLEAPASERRILLTHNGATKSLPEWSRETGINRKTLHYRYVRGLSSAQVLAPV